MWQPPQAHLFGDFVVPVGVVVIILVGFVLAAWWREK